MAKSTLRNGYFSIQIILFIFLLASCGSDDDPVDGTSSSSSAANSQTKNPIETPPDPVLASSEMVDFEDVLQLDQTTNLSGQFTVSDSGAANYTFPISAPMGTAGVAPQVSVVYNSQARISQVGKGWSLAGISAISRCRQTLLQDKQNVPISWSQSDRFCLDGERLLVQSGEYGAPGSTYKTELDRYVTVTAKGGDLGHPDYFDVVAKDGSTTRYGEVGDSDSEKAAYDDAGVKLADRVITWHISRFEDNFHNPMTYRYTDRPQFHQLAKIEYGYGAENTPPMSMEFIYDDSKNKAESYLAGQRFQNAGRLEQIELISARL